MDQGSVDSLASTASCDLVYSDGAADAEGWHLRGAVDNSQKRTADFVEEPGQQVDSEEAEDSEDDELCRELDERPIADETTIDGQDLSMTYNATDLKSQATTSS